MISRRDGNAQRIAAVDARAERLGLRPGMGIADARAMRPGIQVVEEDAAADRRLIESLADWCDRYTPLVALDGADGLFLDVTGCTHLFGGEKALLDDLLAGFFHHGFEARAALASTPGAAWAAARHAGSRIVPPGAEAERIAALPLAALRLDAGTVERLESVGLRTPGALMPLPRAPLARRFGRAPLLRLDQARGHVEEAISPRLPVPPLSVERRLAEPVGSRDDVEGLVLRLAGALRADLERRGEGARLLQLLLFRVDGAVARLSVGASRPLREPALMRKLFSERLAALEGSLDPGCGFDLVRLSVLAAAPFDERQDDLAGDGRPVADELALFVDRVRARFGRDALARPVPVASHVPERAVELVEAGAPGPSRASPATAADRPVRLFDRPEPVEVLTAEVPEGPPMGFRWRRAFYRVARAEGPERIAPEWWREPADAPSRDYFRVEDGDGRRYWLYREGAYGATPPPRWFVQGVFA